MAFSDFKSTLEVAEKYAISIKNGHFLPKKVSLPLPDFFLKDLAYSFRIKKPNPSEIAISENFISPMMRFVAEKHPHIMFWSREFELRADEFLYGKPDYLFSYTLDPEEIRRDTPLVCVAEAKIDDFVYAWGQTLAEMVAIRKLGFDFPIYGWTTNGSVWEFGKLEDTIFVQHSESFSIGTNTEQIAGILDWIFTEAVRHAEDFLARKKAEAELTA